MFTGDDEDHPFDGRPNGTPYVNNKDDTVLVDFLNNNPAAISYFGYAYAVEYATSLTPVAIENSNGDFITPQASTIESGEYNPFSRRIYMNVLQDNTVMNAMKPFYDYAFSDVGKELVREVGVSPTLEE